MDNIKMLAVLLTLVVGSCKQQSESPNTDKIELTHEFLVHEWMIDSIYSSEEFIQDWVYFTPEGEFWRCSNHSKSLLIDSALTFKEDTVFNDGELVYTIKVLDSSHITLQTSTGQIFHLRRWNKFDQKDIKRFIQSNPTKKLLNGNWILDSSEITPAYLPSFCNDLYPTTRFEFEPSGRLKIYPKDSIKECKSYAYRIFKDKIIIFEHDMMMELGVVEISDKNLIISSKYIQNSIEWTEEVMEAEQEGYNLYFSKK